METRTITLPSPQPLPYFTTLSYVLNRIVPKTDVQLRTLVNVHDVVVAFKKSDFQTETSVDAQVEKLLNWKLFGLRIAELNSISLLEITLVNPKKTRQHIMAIPTTENVVWLICTQLRRWYNELKSSDTDDALNEELVVNLDDFLLRNLLCGGLRIRLVTGEKLHSNVFADLPGVQLPTVLKHILEQQKCN